MTFTKSKLWFAAEYALGRTALFFVNLLPERPAYAVMGAIGRLYFRCSRRRQVYALRMLRNAYPDRSDEELTRLARTATGNVFKVILDTVRAIPLVRNGRVLERIDFAGAENVLPQPPYLGLTGHLGSWEIAGIAGAALSGEAHAIARAFQNPLLQRYVTKNREAAGLYIHPKRGGIRDLAAALARGCVGMQVVDQHQRLRGVWVPFFGELASTERAAATLALRRGYPIAVGAAVRVGPGFRFKMIGGEQVTVEPTGDPHADVERIAAEINERLEELVLQYPEQYLWIHNRYRERPAP